MEISITRGLSEIITPRVWPIALLGLLLSGCAESPAKPSAASGVAPAAHAATPAAPAATPPTAASASAAPSSATVATAAPAAAKKPDAQYDQTAVLDKRAREMGYRVENRGGARSYCRSAAPTGSHISREGCLNADGMIRAAKAADDDQDRISQRQMQTCSGCTGSGPIH